MSQDNLARLMLSRGIRLDVIATTLRRSLLNFAIDVYSHTKVDDIQKDTNEIMVQTKLEKGDCKMIECSLLNLLTEESGINIPKNPVIRGGLKTRGKVIVRQDL